MKNTDESASYNAYRMLRWLSEANATVTFKSDGVEVEAALQTVEADTLESAIDKIKSSIEGGSE